jgi:hypothetical protein
MTALAVHGSSAKSVVDAKLAPCFTRLAATEPDGRAGMIDVELRDAEGKVLGRIVDGVADLNRWLPRLADPGFPMLGLLDPYGNTFFNGLQMRSVIPEIRRLRELSPPPTPVALGELEVSPRRAPMAFISSLSF